MQKSHNNHLGSEQRVSDLELINYYESFIAIQRFVRGLLWNRGELIGFWVEFQKCLWRKVAFDSLHPESHKEIFFS